MDKKYITFYKKFILQTKTLNDCRVSYNSYSVSGFAFSSKPEVPFMMPLFALIL